MEDLNDLYYFTKVVEHHGFAPAGRALGMPKSKLSRRIALLEDRLGVRLLQRSTRHFSVTEIGGEYFSHCKAMLVEAEAAQEAIELTRSEPRGTIRMTCPIALLHADVGAMLADFMATCPGITVHLDATNRRVDVIGERFDLALRVRPPPLEDSDLVLRVLAERKWCLVASPSCFANQTAPRVPADLNGFPSLDLGPPHREHVWDLFGPDGATASIHHQPRLISDDMVTLRTAALAGVGITQLPVMLVAEELAQGRLIQLVQDWRPKSGIVHAVFPSRRGLLPSVRKLLDFLAKRFEALDSR